MLNVNEALISEFTEEDVAFSSQFLKQIFLEEDQGIESLSDERLHLVWILIKSVPSKAMKAKIVTALSVDEQLKLISFMDDGEKLLLFEYIDALNLLKPLFKELPAKTQHHILEAMYQKDKAKYKQLKVLLANKVSMVGGILVKQERVLQQFLDQEKSALLDTLADAQTSHQDIQAYAQSLKEKYELEDIENLLKSVIKYFLKAKPTMRNANEFAFYLKTCELWAPYLDIITESDKVLLPFIDLFLANFKSFPSPEWVIRVLDQVSLPILNLVMVRLRNHNKISQFERRQFYSKMIADIESNLSETQGKNIRYILSQL